MRNSPFNKKIGRVVDANFNRAKEGLRVCEDVCRFVYDDSRLTRQFKGVRHDLSDIVVRMGQGPILGARDIAADVGKVTTATELKRRNIKDIVYANTQRVKESIRVLEEFAKLFSPQAAVSLKSLRYKIYALEQAIINKG